MLISNCFGVVTRAALGFTVITVLSACGGGGSGSVDSDQPLLDATVQEGVSGGPLLTAPGGEDFVPNLGENLIPIEASADPGQATTTTDEFIVEQWVHMQNCLQVSAVEPIVTVVDGTLTPLTSNDDVIRHIDGQIQASSNVTDTGATIQIRGEDFAGSLGDPGAYLRSIMGRYLWLANGLAERDYPYDCAR